MFLVLDESTRTILYSIAYSTVRIITANASCHTFYDACHKKYLIK